MPWMDAIIRTPSSSIVRRLAGAISVKNPSSVYIGDSIGTTPSTKPITKNGVPSTDESGSYPYSRASGSSDESVIASITRYWISTSVVSPSTCVGYTGGSGVSLRSTNLSSWATPSTVQDPDRMIVSAENPLPGLPC